MGNETPELKPCPFCGANAMLTDHGAGTGGFLISCEQCSVIMPGGPIPWHEYKTTEDHHAAFKPRVIQKWQTRPETRPALDAGEALKGFLLDRISWLDKERRNGGDYAHLTARLDECKYILDKQAYLSQINTALKGSK